MVPVTAMLQIRNFLIKWAPTDSDSVGFLHIPVLYQKQLIHKGGYIFRQRQMQRNVTYKEKVCNVNS
jgi:hypothetical protein